MQRSKRLHRSNPLPVSRHAKGPRGSATGRKPAAAGSPQRLPGSSATPTGSGAPSEAPGALGRRLPGDLGAPQHQSRPRLGPVHSQYTKRPLKALNHRCPQRRSLEQYQRFTRLSMITSDPDKDLLIRRSSVRARRGPLAFVLVRGLWSASCLPKPSQTRGPCGTFCATSSGARQRVHFESVGRRFEPGGAKRCLRRSAAWVRPRDLPEPPLE